MFRLTCDKSENTTYISFGGIHFSEYLEMLKSHHFQFNKITKLWTASNHKILSILDEINDIEPYEIPKDIKTYLEENRYGVPETRFIRRKFRPELLKSNPLGDYQLEDIKKSIQQNRILYGHEMGLGKTFCAISTINHFQVDNDVEKLFIITPAETVYNWKRELLMFGNFKEEDIYIITKENRDILSHWSDKKVIITTYSTFLLISDYYYKMTHKGTASTTYTKYTFDFSDWGNKLCLILDEGHKAKNHGSRTFKTIKMYKRFFNFRFVLTATPYPNDITEIWALMYLLDESVIGSNYYEFLERIAILGNRFSKYAINRFKKAEVEQVVDNLKPYIIRRFKKDCLPELPDLNIKKIYVEPNSAILEIYRGIISNEINSIKEEDGQLIPRKVICKFPYLTLACSDPSILKDKFDSIKSPNLVKSINNWTIKDNPKTKLTSDIIEEHIEDGDKIILWSTHPAVIDELEKHFNKYNPFCLHGETDTGKVSRGEYRDNILTEFRNSKTRKLAIFSPLVMGVGVNIEFARIAISWDRNWSETIWVQSTGRNHRATSKQDVTHYLLLLDKTLELYQDRILEGKDELNKKLMLMGKISTEDWISIFGGKIGGLEDLVS